MARSRWIYRGSVCVVLCRGGGRVFFLFRHNVSLLYTTQFKHNIVKKVSSEHGMKSTTPSVPDDPHGDNRWKDMVKLLLLTAYQSGI